MLTELTLNHEILMSSYDTDSERAISNQSIDIHDGSQLKTLMGSVGLGYTVLELLQHANVAKAEVIEYLKHPPYRGQACRSLPRIAELQSDQLPDHRLIVSPSQSPQDLWRNELPPTRKIPPVGNHQTQSSVWAHLALFIGKLGLE